jgi:hypothetical protein
VVRALAPAASRPSTLPRPYSPLFNVTQYVPPPGGFPFAVNGYYFRILPQKGESAPGDASNTGLMNWDSKEGGEIPQLVFTCLSNPTAPGCPTPTPPAPAPEESYLFQIISYKTFNPPDKGHEGCYIVTKKATLNWPGFPKVTFNPGDRFCRPPPEEKSWLEAAWDFAAGALNWISKAYNDLKAAVVNLVAKFVPDPPCGKAFLGNILDGALMAMGIPPSIPNFDQLVNQGMDYLAEQATMQIGIPPEVTKGLNGNVLTGKALDEAKAKWEETVQAKFKEGMKAGLEAAQVALSKSVSYVPDGVPVKADPDGEYQMPTMVIRILPNPKYTGPPGCSGTAHVGASARVEAGGAAKAIPTFYKLEKPLMTETTYGLFDNRSFLVPALSSG